MVKYKNKLTKKEKAYIKRLRKAINGVPKDLVIYAVTQGIYVCKIGATSDEVLEFAGFISSAGNDITDMHDDGWWEGEV